MANRPNIIYLNSHDTGRWISPHGSGARTPHLQKLAEEGVLFRQAFNAAPTCSPSRAALLTGQYPHNCGMLGLGNRGFACAEFGHHLAATLKANGYETATCGIKDNHMTAWEKKTSPAALGYERILRGKGPESSLDFIKGPHDAPYFLNVAWILTHRIGRGFTVARASEDDPRHVRLPAPLPDSATVREDWAHYLSDIAEFDRRIGAVLAAVEEAGLKDNTIIIATTDHGAPFPGMKCELTTAGAGVFLIMRGPGGLTGGKAVDGMVSQIDIFPTLCELCGIDPPQWLDGVSMMPLVRGDKEQIHEEIFGEVTYHAAYEPMRAIRTPRYVYIRRFGDRRKPVLPNTDSSPTKDEWLAHGHAERELPVEQLFDVFYNPEEMNNLASTPEHGKVLSDLSARLDKWMRETNDPLLKDPVPLPEGAWANPPDDLQPSNRRHEP